MKITLIAAASENNVIGRDDGLPWHLPDDMEFFRETTEGHPLIMGRKTFESLPGILPNRRHIIVTHDRTYEAPGAEVASSLDEAIMFAKKDNPAEQIFIIGGGEIYAQAMEEANEILLTRVHTEVEGDTYFPEINQDVWEEVDRKEHPADSRHEYDFSFMTYRKRGRLEL